jgi:hypothetical protein
MSGEPLSYSRATDSATAHCYSARPREQGAGREHFVGCWERFLAGGERLSLTITGDGYFSASLDGGDYVGADWGRWEQADSGLVLFPGETACSLGGGVFEDACVRLFDTDDDAGVIHGAQQFAHDQLTELEWVRSSECTIPDGGSDRPAPADLRCSLDAIEPQEVRTVELDIHPSDGGLSMAFLEFTLSPDLLHVDEHDIQRSLVASVGGFTLRSADGTPVAEFVRHARRDPIDMGEFPRQRGDFHIQANAERDLVMITFLHDLRALPPRVELRYEFLDAKYIVNTGARVEVLATN